jgi:hypothetical protein
MAEDGEFTIEEMITLELHAVSVLTQNEYCSPIFFQLRNRLTSLLGQLQRGDVQPEYAEVQLEQVQDIWAQWQKEQDQWRRDNQIPSN